MKFPSWVGNPRSFDQLSELTLRGCENCTDLPTLGHLASLLSSMKAVQTVGFKLLAPTKPFHGNAFPSLESLEVVDMECLEIWSISGGDNVETPQSFPGLLEITFKRCPKLGKVSFGLIPSLESLEVVDMECLEIWSTSGGDDVETPQSFPSLLEITIKRCPKLGKVSFGLIPSLKNLTVEGCPEAVLRALVGVSSSIRTLNLHYINGLTQLDREVLKHLEAVEDLNIQYCYELRCLWESESEACRFLGSLQKLSVFKCPKLESIIKGEKEVVNVGSSIMGSLRQVTLWNCHALKSYCCPNSVERLEIVDCDSMTSLSFSKLQEEDLPSSNLKLLYIKRCKNIKLISQEHLQSLTSLEVMWIYKSQE